MKNAIDLKLGRYNILTKEIKKYIDESDLKYETNETLKQLVIDVKSLIFNYEFWCKFIKLELDMDEDFIDRCLNGADTHAG